MQSGAIAMDELGVFPCLNSSAILDEQKAELSLHLTEPADIDPSVWALGWQIRNATHLKWSSANTQNFVHSALFSAASERIVLLLKVSFTCNKLKWS